MTDRTSTLTTYSDVVDLTRTYCVINDVHMKDFVAGVLRKELGNFKQFIERAKKLKNVN